MAARHVACSQCNFVERGRFCALIIHLNIQYNVTRAKLLLSSITRFNYVVVITFQSIDIKSHLAQRESRFICEITIMSQRHAAQREEADILETLAHTSAGGEGNENAMAFYLVHYVQ